MAETQAPQLYTCLRQGLVYEEDLPSLLVRLQVLSADELPKSHFVCTEDTYTLKGTRQELLFKSEKAVPLPRLSVEAAALADLELERAAWTTSFIGKESKMKRPNCLLISHNRAAMIGDTPALLQALSYTRTQALLFKGIKCTLGNGAEVRVFKSISVGDTLIRRTSEAERIAQECYFVDVALDCREAQIEQASEIVKKTAESLQPLLVLRPFE